MRLYSGPLSMFGAKVEIAALEKGLPVKVFMVPYDPQAGYEPKHPDVLRINPKGQVPVLVDGDLEIFDSSQIFEYFEHLSPTPAFWPADPKARATWLTDTPGTRVWAQIICFSASDQILRLRAVATLTSRSCPSSLMDTISP